MRIELVILQLQAKINDCSTSNATYPFFQDSYDQANMVIDNLGRVEISTEREFTLNFFVYGLILIQFFSAES